MRPAADPFGIRRQRWISCGSGAIEADGLADEPHAPERVRHRLLQILAFLLLQAQSVRHGSHDRHPEHPHLLDPSLDRGFELWHGFGVRVAAGQKRLAG